MIKGLRRAFAVAVGMVMELLSVPGGRWRAAVLFLALTTLKVLILSEQAAHVFQMHFFVGGRVNPGGAADIVGVVVFLSILLLTLGFLAQDLGRESGRVRWRVNLWLSGTGVWFLFLSRYEWRRNWLYPLMEGVLDGGDLWGYLSLSLFFKSPYLAAWLMVYGLGAWWLAWRGRGALLPLLAGGLLVLYVPLCASADWVFRGPELWTLSCLGAAGLWSLHDARAGRDRWLLVPLVTALGVWWMTLGAGAVPERGGPYLVMLAGWTGVWFGAAAWMLGRVGLERWRRMLPFAATSFLLLSNHHHPFAENYNQLIVHSLLAPRYLLDEALLAAACWVLTGWACRRFPNWGGVSADIILLGLVAVGAADLMVTSKMGVRLDWDVLTLTADAGMALRMAKPYLPFILPLLVFPFLLRGWFRKEGLRSNGRPLAGGMTFLSAYFITAAVAGLLVLNDDKVKGASPVNLARTSPWAAALFKRRMSEAEFMSAAGELGFFNAEPSGGLEPAGRPDLNVLLVIMESSHTRHLSLFGGEDETQPRLRAYRDRMELFPNYFMNFPTSNHARTTILTGLHSPRAAIPQLAPRIPVRSLFELFREAGYSTAVFDSCFTEYARFRDFLNARAIDTLLDFHNMPGRDDYERLQWGLPEECTMKAIIDHLRGHAGGERPFFLTYMPVAPHYPYDTRPDEFAVFEGPSPLFTGDYTIRYKNELLYMDWVISSIIDELRALGLLDRTVVVITNDHGERLGDGNGRLGHGWELEPELINQPLIVMDPKRPGARVNREPGSHVDLLPTVLDLAGIAVPADELYQGRSLYRTLGWRKRIHLNSYDHRGVIADGYYLLEEPRGRSVPSVIRSFRIDDSGDRARFVPAEHAYSVTEQMDLFEPFQESLIEHYGHYREVWRRRKQVDRPTD